MESDIISMGEKVSIPGEEHLSDKELKRLKRNEYQRRYMARKRSAEKEKKESGLINIGGIATKRKTKQELRKISTSELIELTQDTRNLTMEVIQAKLIDVMQDPEQFKKINLATLATVFGILYDKTQLMQGLSTENIAVKATIDVNMKSDDALDELNKMREKFQHQNMA